MNDSNDTIVFGYHGTILPSAIDIVTKKNFKRSKNEYDWLGDGAYFFQDAPLRAWLWAKREAKRQGSEPAVVEAEIYLGECIDLLDIHWAHIVRVYHQTMVRTKSLATQKAPIIRTQPRPDFLIEEEEPRYEEKGVGRNKLDREVLNLTVQRLYEDASRIIDSVRAAFQEGHPLYETSFLYDRSHVQIAVRDIDKCIIGDPRLLDTDQLEKLRNDINKSVAHRLVDIGI
jgi:hypothetical protein